MKAVTGKMLTVDLKTGKFETGHITEQLYREYLGGYGLGVALLMERMDPATDPLGPDNILGIAAGYLTGTGAYIASRFMVFGKSPSTKGWGDSNCGAHFGKKLKNAGFDVVLFKEISPEPVYLFIENGVCELLSAEILWGKDTYETEDYLKEVHGNDCEVICIGPAGENLSFLGGISTDKGRFAARSALGAVMGSKKLKAVVIKGNIPIEIANSERMKELKTRYLPVFREDELGKGLSQFGTPFFIHEAVLTGDCPVKNWSSSVEEIKNPDSFNEENFIKYRVKRYGCSGCPIACGGHVKVDKGLFKTESTAHMVEYETIGMFGPNLLNEDIESLMKINDLCNRYGMDTIGCGGLCALAIECFENNLIDKEQTDGLELKWGNSEAIVKLVEKIGKAEGIGAVLSKGFDEAVRVFGKDSRKYAIAVRNEGFSAHDPRWSSDLALTYYSDPTPSRHTQGSTTFPVAGYEMPEFEEGDFKVRAKCHSDNINLYHALSAAGLCLFGFNILDYKTVPEFLNAADGKDWDIEELKTIGLRILVLRHIFNLKAGINFKDFKFPVRVLGNPPLTTGPNKDAQIDLDAMLREYLKEIHFDPETTVPESGILQELNIDQYSV
jgi:aldehyde:ferredoxin oxidoreductase